MVLLSMQSCNMKICQKTHGTIAGDLMSRSVLQKALNYSDTLFQIDICMLSGWMTWWTNSLKLIRIRPSKTIGMLSANALARENHGAVSGGLEFLPVDTWLNRNPATHLQPGRSRLLLTAPPLWLTGAVGSPVTPVATV